MDGFNQMMEPSRYISFKYSDIKGLDGFVPPYDIALCRLFMKFDGHFIRNGVKISATCHLHKFNHVMKPGDVQFPDGYHH